MKGRKLTVIGGSIVLVVIEGNIGLSLPPPEDIPEEILRTEIILEGNSPKDGAPLTVEDYQQVRKQLETSPFPPQLNPKLQQLIFLLKLRKFFRTVIPL